MKINKNYNCKYKIYNFTTDDKLSKSKRNTHRMYYAFSFTQCMTNVWRNVWRINMQKKDPKIPYSFRADRKVIAHLYRLPNASAWINELILKEFHKSKTPIEAIRERLKRKIAIETEKSNIQKEIDAIKEECNISDKDIADIVNGFIPDLVREELGFNKDI